MIICLFCGFVGDSWAVCELTESTDLTPSDEDLYPQDPNVSRMALICEKGKCEDGEIVYVDGTHYIGNMFNSAGFTTVNKDDTIYKCKLGGNDRWVEATSSDIPVSDDRQDFIRGEPIKEMYLYGKKASDGDYYTNVHYVKLDEKCGVECTLSTSADFGGERRLLLCDNKIFYCSMQSMLWEISNGVDQKCDYVSSEHVASGYTYVGVLKDGYPAYTNKSNAITGMVNENDLCWGCPAGEPFSDGTGYCRDNLGEAWCKWRKNKDGKNVEWVDDNHCECKDSGMEWNTEQHDCVKSGKGGKTGAGKTNTNMGNKKSNSKTGSGKVDEKCGVKCNKKTSGKWISCDYEFFTCFDNNDDSNRVIEWQKLHPDFMVIEPCLLLDPSTPKGDNQAMSVYVGDYHDNDTVAIFNKKQDGSFVEETDLCFLCEGEYKYFDIARLNHKDGKECTNNEQLAWCNWRKVKENINTNWQNGECKCLDTGRKWDKETHNCVVDTGGKTSPQSKNNNIDCVVELGASVQCKNGTKFNKNATVSLSAEKCNLYKSNVAKYLNEIAGLLCEKSGGVGNIITDAQVKAATDNINRFFEYAKSNANVWKNADGKFNTARLASDATAGVILGTVGGIVSAKIIKKKQVEKGFDALNCTVGGQKVADFGDEFTIGFGR